MIQEESILDVADNSGAKKVKCIRVLGGTRRRYAYIGDIIVCSVREVAPGSQVTKGQVVKAVVIRQKSAKRRPDGSLIRFDSNAVVLLDDKEQNPRGTRVLGTVAREVRNRGFLKIASMALDVV